MRKFVSLSLACSLVLACSAIASGLKSGDRVGAYHVTDVTGPMAGKDLCYRCKFGNSPVVNVFIKSIDETSVTLFKKLDKQLGENENLKAFVTVLTDDVDASSKELKELAAKAKIKNLPLTVFKGTEGPKSYKLDEESNITVLMWNESKIKTNHSFKKGEMCEGCVASVMSEVPELLK